MTPMVALGGHALIGGITAFLAWNALQSAQSAIESEDWPWARHFMAVSTTWSAATAVIAATSIGGFQ